MINRRRMLRAIHDQLECLNDVYVQIQEEYTGNAADDVLDLLAPVVDALEAAYWRATKVTKDWSPEVREVQADLHAARSVDPQSLFVVEGRKLKGGRRNGLWYGQSSGKLSYRYRRPSGFIMFVPRLGSDWCLSDSFMIKGGMAVEKLEDEVAWIKADKPWQPEWDKKHGSQHKRLAVVRYD